MRVVGVDPGLSRCGVGVVDGPRQRPQPVRAGVIRTLSSEPTSRRLARLHEELRRVIAEVQPDAVAVERVFFNANVRTAMSVGQAAGIVLLCAEQAGLEVAQYTPTEVKSAVAGTGGADKQQVGFMVRALLRLPEVPRPPDAADALALALCHLQHTTDPRISDPPTTGTPASGRGGSGLHGGDEGDPGAGVAGSVGGGPRAGGPRGGDRQATGPGTADPQGSERNVVTGPGWRGAR